METGYEMHPFIEEETEDDDEDSLSSSRWRREGSVQDMLFDRRILQCFLMVKLR